MTKFLGRERRAKQAGTHRRLRLTPAPRSAPEPCGSGAPCCSFPVLRSASCVLRPVSLVSWIPRVLCSVFPSVLPLCSVSCVLCPLYCVPSCVPCFPQSAKGGHRDHGGQRGSLRNEHLPVRWGGGGGRLSKTSLKRRHCKPRTVKKIGRGEAAPQPPPHHCVWLPCNPERQRQNLAPALGVTWVC